MATVPMLSPDGKMGDVPIANVSAAVKAGFKVGADMVHADTGKTGIIPLDKVHDAINSGQFQLRGADPAAPTNPIASAQPSLSGQAYGATESAIAPILKGAYQLSAPGIAASILNKNAPDFSKKLPQAMQDNAAPLDKLPGQIMKTGAMMMTGEPAASPATKAEEVAVAVKPQATEAFAPVSAETPPISKAPEAAPRAPSPEATEDAPAMGKRASAKAVKQAQALAPNSKVLNQAESLRQPINDIVDGTIPPTGKTAATNMRVKSQVDFYLQKGDDAAATKALSDAADKAGLPAPKVNEPLVAGSKADLMDDRHVEESIRAQYDQHGAAAWREMLREQADRNSMDTPKWERVAASRTGADPAARVPYPRFTENLKDITDAPRAELAARQNFIAKHGVEPPQDLTDILQKSVDAAKAAKK